MSDAILDHGGTLVAYMGDGIMAVFGAPIEQDDHADRALAAAREMLDVRLPSVQRVAARERGSASGFRMGIGLNSGRVMSGNVGSERRLEYTAIGDTTNTAAAPRGDDQGHAAPCSSWPTRPARRLKDAADDLVYVDEFEVRGREAEGQALVGRAKPSASGSRERPSSRWRNPPRHESSSASEISIGTTSTSSRSFLLSLMTRAPSFFRGRKRRSTAERGIRRASVTRRSSSKTTMTTSV